VFSYKNFHATWIKTSLNKIFFIKIPFYVGVFYKKE
jgi:hypothetical protein